MCADASMRTCARVNTRACTHAHVHKHTQNHTPAHMQAHMHAWVAVKAKVPILNQMHILGTEDEEEEEEDEVHVISKRERFSALLWEQLSEWALLLRVHYACTCACTCM